MPFLTVGGTRLYYRLEGNEGRPVLVLSSSIGTDHGLWAPQVPELLPYFQVLRYDTRGHGASDAPPGEYSLEMLGRDVLALADALRIQQFGFCGLSLGGMIGQWLGIHAPSRLTRLVLANTSPRIIPKSHWDDRRRLVLEKGMAAIVPLALQRFFSPATIAQEDPAASTTRATLLGTKPEGYAGCCSAIRDMDHTGELHGISVPTLVICGERDISTPWAGHGDLLAQGIPGARAVHLPAAHLSNLEAPRSFTAALLDFLLPHAARTGFKADSADPVDAGLAVRRAVLGEAHVDRSLASATDFNRDFQALITRYAWGSIWTRPGFDRRTRRLLVMAMMASLGRWEEFRMHVRAALEHGMETCDLKELLLQTAIYAGVPAANTGFHIAIEEIEKQKRPAQ